MPPAQAAQRWMNGCAAILTVMTRRVPRHDCLGGAPKNPESTATTKKILENSWDIESREKLVETLGWLRDSGHRAEGAPLAWDLVRLVAVAGWGYVADLISEDEAWGFITPAAKQLQGTYASWEQLGKTYVEGTSWWKEEAGPDCQKIYDKLVNDPQSPWRSVPWGWNLDAADQRRGSSKLLPVLVVGSIAIGIGSVVALNVYKGFKKYRTANPEKSGEKIPEHEKKDGWDGKTPFTCGGSQTVTIENVTADFHQSEAVPLTAMGGCHLTLVNDVIRGGTVLFTGGSAVVDIQGGALTGSQYTISAGGSSKVTYKDTKLDGATQHSGGATITEIK
jgi:hypothetical protein